MRDTAAFRAGIKALEAQQQARHAFALEQQLRATMEAQRVQEAQEPQEALVAEKARAATVVQAGSRGFEVRRAATKTRASAAREAAQGIRVSP